MSPQIHLDKYLYKNFWKMHLFALKKDLYLVSLQACDVRNTWWWLYRCILISKLIELGTLNMWRDFLVCPPYLHKMFLKRLKKKKNPWAKYVHMHTYFLPLFYSVKYTQEKGQVWWINDPKIKISGLHLKCSLGVLWELGSRCVFCVPVLFPKPPYSLYHNFTVI